MTEVPKLKWMGCKIYIDFSSYDYMSKEEKTEFAERFANDIGEMFNEFYHKPDWYYKAMAKNTLGITK